MEPLGKGKYRAEITIEADSKDALDKALKAASKKCSDQADNLDETAKFCEAHKGQEGLSGNTLWGTAKSDGAVVEVKTQRG